LGLLYAAEPSASVATLDNTEYEQMIEHVLFPAFRSRLCPQRPGRRSEIGMDGDNHNLQLSAVVLIAQLPELYKVFERC
jgi:hypothetical protein